MPNARWTVYRCDVGHGRLELMCSVVVVVVERGMFGRRPASLYDVAKTESRRRVSTRPFSRVVVLMDVWVHVLLLTVNEVFVTS
jgi:hypothetical protein